MLKAVAEAVMHWWDEHLYQWPNLHLEVQPRGIRWRPVTLPPSAHLIPVVELRPLKDGRWVVLCLKYSLAGYSRSVYSYGGIFISVDPLSSDVLRDVLDFLDTGFAPSRRPRTLRKTLRIDLLEWQETADEEGVP